MRIAVIGAGRVGATLGGRWRETGHDVVYGVRDPADARYHDLGEVATIADAVAGAEVVLVSLPWAAVADVVGTLTVGDAVVIDATNPLATNARELAGHPDLSGAELIAEWTGSPKVVKAFNTTGSGNMADTGYPDLDPMMPVAGDDDEAKRVVRLLAAELGFEPVDAGPLAAARDLEHLAMLWIRLAHTLGQGPDIAFALLRR